MDLLALQHMTRFAAYAVISDMKAGIRRTGLGPLWPTLGQAFLVACLGLFFGTILKQQLPELEVYIPFLVTGMIAWTFLTNCIHHSSSLIWGFLNTLRHNRMTLAVPVLRAMLQSAISLVLNITIALIVAGFYFDRLEVHVSALAAGLFLLGVNAGWMSYVTALACARFRDLPQLIAWGIHLGFFLTPILWVEQNLGRYEYLLYFNPFSWLITLVRRPLLGQTIDPQIWLAAGVLAVLGSLLALWLSRRTANRLPYWL
jgi:lipopolysaccharide transport system permease protein